MRIGKGGGKEKEMRTGGCNNFALSLVRIQIGQERREFAGICFSPQLTESHPALN